MIYFAVIGSKKPQRIDEQHAHDFYQMWFGNERGQERFDNGEFSPCPDWPSLVIYGEDIKEASVFKKILVGEVPDGMFDIDELIG